MNDGVGMTPEDEGTSTTDTSSASAAGERKPAPPDGSSSARKTTNVTGWTGATDATAGDPAASREATTDVRSAGKDTVYTEDPAMADQPVEGGVEEAER